MDRNLNPRNITKEVILARCLFGHEYSKQNGGQVDFYEKLSPQRKKLCREIVDDIEKVELRERQS
jgi:hypothetical protein